MCDGTKPTDTYIKTCKHNMQYDVVYSTYKKTPFLLIYSLFLPSQLQLGAFHIYYPIKNYWVMHK